MASTCKYDVLHGQLFVGSWPSSMVVDGGINTTPSKGKMQRHCYYVQSTIMFCNHKRIRGFTSK